MSNAASGHRNRLSGETSPYLRQHAANPVDWYPWGEAALSLARREHKPILLSIGYAACHWCHVMAHESFEDAATARLMNERFVNIKVDREERPDLDRLYQLAHQLLSSRGGGWPLTVFLLHDDQRPFFAGTYFPPEPRHGMPSFRDLLLHVADYYRDHEDQLRTTAGAVVSALGDMNSPPASERGPDARPASPVLTASPALPALDAGPLQACRAQLERSFDRDWGGFGAAPKFPHAPLVDRLLRTWYASAGDPVPDLQALYMATLTLKRMAEGGLFDQLGGGFYRYSVDAQWAIPHFEKMLYDNAALLSVYADAARATGDPFYAEIAGRTADWLLKDMRAPGGAFYSSLDADAAGHEGSFYVWQTPQVREALTPDEFAVFTARFGLDRPPNFEAQSHHLVIASSLEELAAMHGRTAAELEALLTSAREKLLTLRATRPAPARDEKILTSWNALTIRALAVGARALQRADLAAAASEALDFLRTHHWRGGRLLATSAGGEARLNAYLDDYVFLADAILELSSVRFNAADLHFACELLEVVLAHFADPEGGGFFFTSDDHEPLISRPKTFGDDALPAGNAVAAVVFQRLGLLLGEERFLRAAEHTLRAAWPALVHYPPGHATLLQALEESLHPPEFVIVRAPPATLAAWQQAIGALYAPRRLLLAIGDDAANLPAALAAKAAMTGGVAYLCRGSVCSAPLTSLAALSGELQA